MSESFDVWEIHDGRPPQARPVPVGSLAGYLDNLPGPSGPIYVDTETSGLRVDSGARVVAVSVAYRYVHEAGGPYADTLESSTLSFAVPFDMGWDRTKVDAHGTFLPHHRDCPLFASTAAKRAKTAVTRRNQLERALGAKRPNAERIEALRREVVELNETPACGCPVTVNANQVDWEALGRFIVGNAERYGWIGQNQSFDRLMLAAGVRNELWS